MDFITRRKELGQLRATLAGKKDISNLDAYKGAINQLFLYFDKNDLDHWREFADDADDMFIILQEEYMNSPCRNIISLLIVHWFDLSELADRDAMLNYSFNLHNLCKKNILNAVSALNFNHDALIKKIRAIEDNLIDVFGIKPVENYILKSKFINYTY